MLESEKENPEKLIARLDEITEKAGHCQKKIKNLIRKNQSLSQKFLKSLNAEVVAEFECEVAQAPADDQEFVLFARKAAAEISGVLQKELRGELAGLGDDEESQAIGEKKKLIEVVLEKIDQNVDTIDDKT